jgi:hypothetical protein
MLYSIFAGLTISEVMVKSQLNHGKGQLRPGNICLIKQGYL